MAQDGVCIPGCRGLQIVLALTPNRVGLEPYTFQYANLVAGFRVATTSLGFIRTGQPPSTVVDCLAVLCCAVQWRTSEIFEPQQCLARVLY